MYEQLADNWKTILSQKVKVIWSWHHLCNFQVLSDSKSGKNLQCAPLRHSQTSVIKMPDVIIYQCDQTLASNWTEPFFKRPWLLLLKWTLYSIAQRKRTIIGIFHVRLWPLWCNTLVQKQDYIKTRKYPTLPKSFGGDGSQGGSHTQRSLRCQNLKKN